MSDGLSSLGICEGDTRGPEGIWASLTVNREAGSWSRLAGAKKGYPASSLLREPSWKLARCGGKGIRLREPEQARNVRE
jgi:hypothetical protein